MQAENQEIIPQIMKKILVFLAALLCCNFALIAQSPMYNHEPVMSLNDIAPGAVYVLGYQDGNDYYLHTSGTEVGQMQLSKNPGSPVEYKFFYVNADNGGIYYANCTDGALYITAEGVSLSSFNPFDANPFSLSITDGNISSRVASDYTVYHDGNIIKSHTGSSAGNLCFFERKFCITVSANPSEGGTVSATCNGESVQTASGGSEITVTATPNEICRFLNWTENGTQVSAEPSFTFTLTSDRNLVANFEFDPSAEIPDNQIWYTSTNKQKVTPNNSNAFGATISSNVYDAEMDMGVITFDGNVTSIGNEAFKSCSTMKSVTLPNTVTSIGEYAFYYCEYMTSATLSNSLTSIGNGAFRNCYFLSSIAIPSSVTSIGNYAFCYCERLVSVTISDGVTSIGEYAFWDCSNLASATIPNSVTSIGIYAFLDCTYLTSVTLSNSVTKIRESTFQGCSRLTSITIPSSVTSIGKSAFQGCSRLTSVTLSNSVKSIGESTFQDCSRLTSITIPSSVTGIGKSAFQGCSRLTSISIPDGVTSIQASTFEGCSGLTSVNISSNVTSIGGSAFKNCSVLPSITIPGGVTSIQASTFEGCSVLASINIPSNVTSIGGSAFKNCSSLISVTLPSRVTHIRESAFESSGLTSIAIPGGVTSIGKNAFKSCTSLASVSFQGSTCQNAIGNDAFSNVSSQSNLIDLTLPDTWEDMYLPINDHTVWHGGYFNCGRYYETIALTSITDAMGEYAEIAYLQELVADEIVNINNATDASTITANIEAALAKLAIAVPAIEVGQAMILENLPTEGTTGPAVRITKQGKSDLILINPDKVEFIKIEEIR